MKVFFESFRRKVVDFGPVRSMHSLLSMDRMYAIAANLRTSRHSGETIVGIYLLTCHSNLVKRSVSRFFPSCGCTLSTLTPATYGTLLE